MNNQGFSLMELLIASTISVILLLGLIQLFTSARSGFLLQEELATINDRMSFAFSTLSSHIHEAGYTPYPWSSHFDLSPLTDEIHNDDVYDRIGLQTWSDRNCYGNLNPIKDHLDRPRFFLKKSRFQVNRDGNLTHLCRYGPDATTLTTQINHLSVINQVESLQFLYAEDSDGDQHVDRWISGDEWSGISDIKAVQIGLLLAGQAPLFEQQMQPYQLLDMAVVPPADGRLHRPGIHTANLRKYR